MNTSNKNTCEHAIRVLYDGDPEREWQRMARHRTEFAVTFRALEEHLPSPPARILDCGGGPGRYAIALAQRGYEVTLFDLSPELLRSARHRAEEAGVRLAGFEQGTATDLSRFAEAAFDAVLLMGPLYHLLDEEERRAAVTEAYRVVKPGGPVFAAFIARYAGHRDAAAYYPEQAAESPELYRRLADTGVLSPPEDGSVRFVAYFAHPNEVGPLCREAGLDVVTVLGVEGVVSGHEEAVNALTGAAWEFWVDTNYRIAQDPTVHGGCEHLLAVCRKPLWRSVMKRIAVTLAEHEVTYHVVGGTSLALRGLPVKVNDLDLEMPTEDAYHFQRLFADYEVMPVAWRESDDIRSHFGAFEIDGLRVEVMAALERRRSGRWVPSFLWTDERVDLDGVPIPVLMLEEEVLAMLRRGRTQRAALALPHCDPDRLQELLAKAGQQGMF